MYVLRAMAALSALLFPFIYVWPRQPTIHLNIAVIRLECNLGLWLLCRVCISLCFAYKHAERPINGQLRTLQLNVAAEYNKPRMAPHTLLFPDVRRKPFWPSTPAM